MKNELSIIFKGVELSEKELSYLASFFTKETYVKGSLLLDTDKKVTYQCYVVKGCLRTFFVDKEGKDHTIQFAVKDWWISDYMSYFLNEESVLTVEAIEESVLLKISREDFEIIFDEIPAIERFIRKKLERFMAKSQKRMLQNLSLSAKEHYINFTKAYPDIEKHVKNYHIASYLGITTQSLSRIRKDILIDS
ncbi:MAG: Crp/Fnr family transcriptional regulator [Tenacibaculum sp.]